MPDSPVEPVQGWAQLVGQRSPRARGSKCGTSPVKPVKYVELGWIVSDEAGRQYMAGSLPSSEPSLYLPPAKAPAFCRRARSTSRATASR